MISFFKKLIDKLYLSLNIFNKKQTIQNSPNSTQIQGNGNVVNPHPSLVPEIQLSLYGSGAKGTFEGDITNKSDRSVVLKFIEINNTRTDLNQNLNKLIFIRDNKIQLPQGIFNNIQSISLKLRFEDIGGNIYEVSQNGKQEPRSDGKFNITFSSSKYTQIN